MNKKQRKQIVDMIAQFGVMGVVIVVIEEASGLRLKHWPPNQYTGAALNGCEKAVKRLAEHAVDPYIK